MTSKDDRNEKNKTNIKTHWEGTTAQTGLEYMARTADRCHHNTH